MQPSKQEKQVFIFRYKDKKIPKRLTVDQNFKNLLGVAKSLFICPDEEQYYLAINGNEINEELVLSDLKLEDQAILDLVQKVSKSSDLLTFQILSDSTLFTWQGSASKPIREALEAFCIANNLIFSSFEPCLDGECLGENVLLEDIPDLDDAIIDLVPKTQTQDTPTEEGPQEEKQIHFILNGKESYDLFVTWRDSIKSLKPALAKIASLTTETFQIWSAQGKELDDEESLSSQLSPENLIIEVQLLKYATLKIGSKDKQFELLMPIYPTYTIEQLKTKFEKEIKIKSTNQIWYFSESNEILSNEKKIERISQ